MVNKFKSYDHTTADTDTVLTLVPRTSHPIGIQSTGPMIECHFYAILCRKIPFHCQHSGYSAARFISIGVAVGLSTKTNSYHISYSKRFDVYPGDRARVRLVVRKKKNYSARTKKISFSVGYLLSFFFSFSHYPAVLLHFFFRCT